MFQHFFHELRAAKVPVTLKEFLTLLEAMDKGVVNGASGSEVQDFYYLSRAALEMARAQVAPHAADVVSLVGSYEDGLLKVPSHRNGRPLLMLFLGSNIGNFDRAAANVLLLAQPEYRAILDAGGWPQVPVKADAKNGGQNALIKRLAAEDPVLAAIPKPSAAQLRDAIKRFQVRNGLEAVGLVGSRTIAALNVLSGMYRMQF